MPHASRRRIQSPRRLQSPRPRSDTQSHIDLPADSTWSRHRKQQGEPKHPRKRLSPQGQGLGCTAGNLPRYTARQRAEGRQWSPPCKAQGQHFPRPYGQNAGTAQPWDSSCRPQRWDIERDTLKLLPWQHQRPTAHPGIGRHQCRRQAEIHQAPGSSQRTHHHEKRQTPPRTNCTHGFPHGTSRSGHPQVPS